MKPSNINTSQPTNGGYGAPITGGVAGQLPINQGGQVQNAPMPKGDGGNWLTSLLPSGGGIAGGLGGAALGASIGSVVPIIGTGIGGLLGGILGAAGGGGIGKVAENSAEGKALDDGVANEALMSGAGQLVGGGIGKVIGKGASLLAGKAGKITEAAAQDAAQAATKNGVTDVAAQYKDISPQLQKAYNADKSIAHVQGLGFNGVPDDLVAVGNTSNDILNSTLNSTLSKAGTVDLSHYNDLIKAALAKRSGTLGSYDKIAVSAGKMGAPNTGAAKTLGQLEDLGAGIAKTDSDPIAIRDLTTKLYKAGQDAKPVRNSQGVIDPAEQERYDAIMEVRNGVKSSLYNRPEVNDALTALKGNLQHTDTLDNQALADHLNGVVTKAGTGNNPAAQDILDELQRNINISKLGQEGQNVRQIVTSRGGQDRILADKGIPAGQAQAIDPATGVPLSLGSELAGTKGMVGKGFVVAKHAANNPKILDTLSRIGDLGSKVAPPAGAGAGAALGQLASGSDQAQTIGGQLPMQPTGVDPTQGGQLPPQAPQSPTGGLSREDLLTLALYSPGSFSTLTAPSADNQAKVSGATTAEQALSGLGPAPTGGILSQLGATLGVGPTAEYQRKAAGVAQQVAAALPGSDAGTIEKQLTAYMAGGGSIDDAVRQLIGSLQAVKQNNTNGTYQGLMNYNPSVIGAAGL